MTQPGYRRNTERPWFPGDNYWGIPDLLPDQLSAAIPDAQTRFVVFRTVRLSEATASGSIVSFFVDDYRFACAWSYPDRLINTLLQSRIAAAIEPDFSTWEDAPRIEQIHAVYRTRWVGRYWQSFGIPVIPCLQWSDRESYEWAWSGIPHGVPVAAVECRTGGKVQALFNEGLAAACAATQPQTLLIYGPQNDWVAIPRGITPVWIEPYTNRRFRWLQAQREAGV